MSTQTGRSVAAREWNWGMARDHLLSVKGTLCYLPLFSRFLFHSTISTALRQTLLHVDQWGWSCNFWTLLCHSRVDDRAGWTEYGYWILRKYAQWKLIIRKLRKQTVMVKQCGFMTTVHKCLNSNLPSATQILKLTRIKMCS